MANELRSHLIPAPKRTLFIWTLLAAMLLTAVLYASGMTSVTKAQTPPTGYTLNTAIGAPTGLSARVSPNNKIVIINWTAPSGVTADGYQVSRQLMPLTTIDPEVIVENSGDDKLKYRDSSITAPGNYTYWVRTVQGTEVSSAASVVTPYVWLEEPPASTQVSPHPTVNEFTQTIQDELFRLETRRRRSGRLPVVRDRPPPQQCRQHHLHHRDGRDPVRPATGPRAEQLRPKQPGLSYRQVQVHSRQLRSRATSLPVQPRWASRSGPANIPTPVCTAKTPIPMTPMHLANGLMTPS